MLLFLLYAKVSMLSINSILSSTAGDRGPENEFLTNIIAHEIYFFHFSVNIFFLSFSFLK